MAGAAATALQPSQLGGLQHLRGQTRLRQNAEEFCDVNKNSDAFFFKHSSSSLSFRGLLERCRRSVRIPRSCWTATP